MNIDMSDPRQSLSLKIGVGIAAAINSFPDSAKPDAEELLMAAAATGWALGRCSDMTLKEKTHIEEMWDTVKPYYDAALCSAQEDIAER
ncbi:MAG: hypothetical protein LKF93_09635 [Bifidobacterium tibiigranuli]|jgi:hypothetical protein|nr:hypothetical protein [Bifidobacterium tibiigranuli]